jgi:hypothetical protein
MSCFTVLPGSRTCVLEPLRTTVPDPSAWYSLATVNLPVMWVDVDRACVRAAKAQQKLKRFDNLLAPELFLWIMKSVWLLSRQHEPSTRSSRLSLPRLTFKNHGRGLF